LRMALTRRAHGADLRLIHHSDAGSQPGLNRSSQQCLWDERTDRRRQLCRSLDRSGRSK
jgi:hypothetical protein